MQIETRRPCQQNQGNFSAANTALVYESIETDTLDTYELAALVMGAKPAVRRSPQYPAIVAETLRRVEAENDLLTVRRQRLEGYLSSIRARKQKPGQICRTCQCPQG